MLTQTRPLPPPGAGVAREVETGLRELAVLFAGVAVAAAAGAGLLLFRLKKFPRPLVGLAAGEAAEVAGAEPCARDVPLTEGAGEEVMAAAAAFLRARFAAGEGEGDIAASAAGAGEAIAFFRLRFGLGEAAGEALASADGAGEASAFASAFLWLRCFAGEADGAGEALPLGVGDCAFTRGATQRARRRTRRFLGRMGGTLGKSGEKRKWKKHLSRNAPAPLL